MKQHPSVSIVTCTYNGERIIDRFLKRLFSQTYPKDKIEIILADGGSTDKTLEIIKSYQKKYPKILQLYHNKKQYPDGKGMGVDTFSRKARGEMVLLLDQDNILIQDNWIEQMVSVLVNHPEIACVQTRMAIPKNATIIDQYIGAIGIEDPFSVPYALNSQITIHPELFEYNKEGDFFVYEINKKQFYYAGGNGFLMRKDEFFKAGGYTQDIDNFYRMADKQYKVALPRLVKLHHQTATTFRNMIEKRAFYGRHYVLNNYEDRDFYWFNLKKMPLRHNIRFLQTVMFNLLFFPALFQGLRLFFRDKKRFWLAHPFILFGITLAYIYTFFHATLVRKQKSAAI